ncbi:MAG: hypothetical protein HY049_12850 [Acidobacteria bacterium]|nr:hypothetical protein [Acidobacteriota bacterium]
MMELGDFASTFDEAGKIKTGAYVDGLTRMNYDVVGIGDSELAGGLDAYADLFGKAPFPAISATYTMRGSERTFLPPYVVKSFDLPSGKSIRVAFLALSQYNSLLARTATDGRIVVSRDPADQARRFTAELNGKADLVVLLANLSPQDLLRVAQAAGGSIQIAAAGFGDRLTMTEIEEIGGIKVFYPGNEGKRLGEIRVYLDGTKIKQLRASVIHLTKRFPEEPKLQEMVQSTLVRVNDAMRNAAAASAPAPSAASARLALPPPESPTAARKYLGTAACKDCHHDAYRVWTESRHASAMQTLVKATQDFNPECVKCHVTGYGTAEGFQTNTATPALANVQCEACHGIAGAHIQDTSRQGYGRVAPRVCYACHTRENSPEFSFYKYWEQIKH